MVTEKQKEVFELMATGMPKSEISRNLGVTERTVERVFEELRGIYGAKTNPTLYSTAATYLLVGELMATLENVVLYSINLDVKRLAEKRLKELEEKYKDL